jgi:hypothetical protein
LYNLTLLLSFSSWIGSRVWFKFSKSTELKWVQETTHITIILNTVFSTSLLLILKVNKGKLGPISIHTIFLLISCIFSQGLCWFGRKKKPMTAATIIFENILLKAKFISSWKKTVTMHRQHWIASKISSWTA